jgi:hypothetical protein
MLGPVKAGEGAKNIIMGLQICNLNQLKLCVWLRLWLYPIVAIGGLGGICKNVGEYNGRPA